MKILQIFFIVIVMSGVLAESAEAGFFSWLLDRVESLQQNYNGNTSENGNNNGNLVPNDSINNKGFGIQHFDDVKINTGAGSVNLKFKNPGTQGNFNNKGPTTQTIANVKINSGRTLESFGSPTGKDGGGEGTTHQFNHHGSGTQDFNNVEINSGTNTGDRTYGKQDYYNWNMYESSSFMNHVSGTQNVHGTVIKSNRFSRSGGIWETTWESTIYRVRSQRTKSAGKCKEHIWITGLKDTFEKYFQLECLANGQSRNLYNMGVVLLIGDQKEEFCAFTSKRNELYYMQKGKWKKCTLKPDNVQEQDLGLNEVAKIIERIAKWEGLFERNRKETENIRRMEGETWRKHDENMRKIGEIQREERAKTRTKNDEIRKLWQQETQRQREEQRRLNDVGRSTGWGGEYYRLLGEEQKRMDRENDRIYQLQNEENERSNREDYKYMRMMEEEGMKYQEEYMKINNLSEQEAIKFDKEFQQFIIEGW